MRTIHIITFWDDLEVIIFLTKLGYFIIIFSVMFPTDRSKPTTPIIIQPPYFVFIHPKTDEFFDRFYCFHFVPFNSNKRNWTVHSQNTLLTSFIICRVVSQQMKW